LDNLKVKIINIIFLMILEEIKWNNLIVKEYVIKNDKIYKGKFVKYTPNHGGSENCQKTKLV